MIKPMLASSNLNTITYPAYAETKWDGVRLIFEVTPYEVEVYTRNGKSPYLPYFKGIFSTFPPGVYDGEIVYTEGKLKDRTTVSGLINSAIHGGCIDESKLIFMVFDNVLPNFLPYHIRRSLLIALVEKQGWMQVKTGSSSMVADIDDATRVYRAALADGYEGIILKNRFHMYSAGKRTKDWVKLKETKTADLTCTGIITGRGKYDGAIGALTLVGHVEGKEVKVNAGSGLTDYDRYQPVSTYLDKTIEVKYNSVTKAIDSKYHSLFLPRFKCIREDK